MSARRWLPALLLGCSAARPPVVVAPTDTTPPSSASAPRAPRPLSWGNTRGELTRELPRRADGRRAVTYALRLEPPQRVRIALRGSENLDALLEVRGPDGFSLTHDDVPGSLDAMVEFVPPSAGTYEVTATSANPRQTGPYLLAVSPRAPAVGVPLPPDGRVEGVYAPQTTDPDGFPGEWFHTEVRAGSRLRVRANSRAFDTVLTVLGPRGERWTNDDANDTGPDGSERALDSTVEVAAPETGTYHVLVNAYGGGSGGPFRLTSRALPPVVLHPGQDTPPGGLAGPDGRGRVLGLYAGITSYEHQSHLYGCADDARFLGQAFRASHLQGPSEQQVLTDGQVTRQAFLAGIDRLAQRSTPDDVVLVFFSGHGGTSPDARPGGDELSGLDATVVMQDGSITDDELVEHLSRVRARTVILALDTCHAGGFADDWVRAPGRVGLFSSDADVLSDTAEPRGAGGYLSIHLRRGVLGDADARPRDGVLQLGELTDHLHRGFVEDYLNMNPEGSQEPSQWLVASRGAVPWTEVLWAYPRGEDLALPPIPAVTLESPSIHGDDSPSWPSGRGGGFSDRSCPPCVGDVPGVVQAQLPEGRVPAWSLAPRPEGHGGCFGRR